ncbi:hypothetical protein SKAU_G00401870 [Synaphobranchus kaupii]|uniref:Uncharacterized protein n=1 Tax=Synaphobranchus kaupii TaxID=118154 RepID=A0A9Q1E966_SYNKA|nr:hypothetical protein SKAU_G00401870 [Synaphobranchus kaupii]
MSRNPPELRLLLSEEERGREGEECETEAAVVTVFIVGSAGASRSTNGKWQWALHKNIRTRPQARHWLAADGSLRQFSQQGAMQIGLLFASFPLPRHNWVGGGGGSLARPSTPPTGCPANQQAPDPEALAAEFNRKASAAETPEATQRIYYSRARESALSQATITDNRTASNSAEARLLGELGPESPALCGDEMEFGLISGSGFRKVY